mgnify:CR=1 FL=1
MHVDKNVDNLSKFVYNYAKNLLNYILNNNYIKLLNFDKKINFKKSRKILQFLQQSL